MGYELLIDIPAKAIDDYMEAITDKKERGHKCKVWPRGRFVTYKGEIGITFSGLVCSDIGGQSTGLGAGRCNNCNQSK